MRQVTQTFGRSRYAGFRATIKAVGTGPRGSRALSFEEAREAMRAVLEGEDRGPHRDCLLLGAALALEVAGQVAKPREGIERAAAAIESGAAARVLAALVPPRGEPG